MCVVVCVSVCLCDVADLALSVRQCDEVVPVTLKTFRTELSSAPAAVAAAAAATDADMDSRRVVRTVTSRRSVPRAQTWLTRHHPTSHSSPDSQHPISHARVCLSQGFF